ncbi:MAG: glycosyltransferase [Acidobacteria bacterium]|nr:glycosyltransferase [Acidobacteriota bacterium]
MTSRAEVRITAVISSLACGGAERVMSILCNHWSGANQVTLLTFDDGLEPPFFPLSPAVCHRPLGLAGRSTQVIDAVVRNAGRVRLLRRAIEASTPDVVVSFGDRTNVTVLLATRGLHVPVVVSERSDPRNFSPGWAWSVLRAFTYRQASSIVHVATEGREWFRGSLARKVRVIPNPVAVAPARRRDPKDDDVVRLVSVGRLAHEKGHDLLLEALASLSPDTRQRVSLTVVGDGPLREALEARASTLGLEQHVRWAGRQQDPLAFVNAAHVFVLPSRFEGFPNALAEAMAAGLAVVATDCRSGPRELIDDGRSGLLVPVDDIAALAAAITELVADPTLRRRLAAEAPAATHRLHVDRVADEWQALFAEVRARNA